MNRLQNKVAIITGGTKGIGYGIAKRFLAEGAKVVITGRNAEVGAAAAADLGDPSVVTYLQQDVTDEARWTEVYDQTEALYGPVTTLVNNSGIAIGKNVEDTTTEDWHTLLAINLDAVFFGTRLAIKRMKNKDLGGSIINMSSIEGFIGDPNLAAYNASKGAVRIFSKSAALHCAINDLGVRVNTVHPGYIRTPMVEGLTGFEEAMSVRSKTPMGHIGDPDDIGYICVYLASDESKFATGSEFVVDGGYTAQ
ncbi:MAG: SDR family oxidoreductase [Lactobacillus sp.]|jgi:NAD(P)-dependent dehydrogenase (short-subunit alcohol dehydrogenase family)|nr:SDR family oxidoreductase [Lactobacillus sp.]